MRNMASKILIVLSYFSLISSAQTDDSAERILNGLRAMTRAPEGATRVDPRSSLRERLDHYRIPGMSIAVIDNYEILWSRAIGILNVKDGTTASTNSIYQVGSVSKAVTAAIVLHYVSEGVLDLDVDINRYLTSWQVPENEFTHDQKVTLRTLLSHQSGFPITNFGSEEGKKLPTLPQILKAESPALNKPAISSFIPGSEWNYSNIGYTAVQLVLEDVLKKSFEQIAQEVLFKPLKMKNSTFTYPLPEAWQSREALPHGQENETLEAAQYSTSRAQGGLLTTPEDLAKLVIELMKARVGRSNTIMSEDIAQKYFERQVDVPPGFFSKSKMGMGLGVFLHDEGKDVSILHWGSSYPGSEAMFIGFPFLGKGAIIVSNSYPNNDGGALYLELLSAMKTEYGWPSGDYYFSH